MKGVMRLLIPACLENVRLAGAVTNRIVEEIVDSEVERYRLELAVVEALTNVVKYGYSGRDDGNIELQISHDREYLEFSIIDDGAPFDPSQAKVVHLDPQDLDGLPERGMGILLIREAVDDLTYSRKDGKNYLTLRKRITAPNGD